MATFASLNTDWTSWCIGTSLPWLFQCFPLSFV